MQSLEKKEIDVLGQSSTELDQNQFDHILTLLKRKEEIPEISNETTSAVEIQESSSNGDDEGKSKEEGLEASAEDLEEEPDKFPLEEKRPKLQGTSRVFLLRTYIPSWNFARFPAIGNARSFFSTCQFVLGLRFFVLALSVFLSWH